MIVGTRVSIAYCMVYYVYFIVLYLNILPFQNEVNNFIFIILQCFGYVDIFIQNLEIYKVQVII